MSKTRNSQTSAAITIQLQKKRQETSWLFCWCLIAALGFFAMGYTIAKVDAKQQITQLQYTLNGLDDRGIRTDRMAEFYQEREMDYNVSRCKTDAEFSSYCQKYYPEAVYFSTDWTPEEVVQSFYDQPDIWGYYETASSIRGFYFSWTSDYAHCFIMDTYYRRDLDESEIKTGWLCVDGIRVYPLYAKERIVSDISPERMIQDYQSGAWDGSTRVSADYSTTVSLSNYNGGILDYCYEAWRYDATFDPDGIAYTGFAEAPWWLASDLNAEQRARINGYAYEEGIWQEDRTAALCYMDYYLYVDLPMNYDVSDIVSATRSEKIGTLCSTQDSVLLFKNGQLLEKWENVITADEKATVYFPVNPEDCAYLYDGVELWALRTGGEKVRLFDSLEYANISNGIFYGLEDQKLSLWRLSTKYISMYIPQTIAENVEKMYFPDQYFYGTLMVKKSDGCYLIKVYGDDVTEELLGTEPLEYYTELYQIMC